MSVAITVAYLVLNLPSIIAEHVDESMYIPWFNLLYLLNCSVMPAIYFWMSRPPKKRMEVKSMSLEHQPVKKTENVLKCSRRTVTEDKGIQTKPSMSYLSVSGSHNE